MYFIITFGLTIILATSLHWQFSIGLPASWFIVITVVTFLTYRHDKKIAGSNKRRVPESVLLALALFGGTFGAIVSMQRYHHKTSKASFKLKFGLVIGLQVLVLLGYCTFSNR